MEAGVIISDLIEIKDMVFYRGERVIFNGLCMSVAENAVTSIIGPSGTGKTTLLRLIGGQLVPASGTVRVMGENVSKLSRAGLFELRKKMGLLFQSSALFTDLTVYENVAFSLRVHTDLSDSLIHNLVLMKLNSVGLRGARDLMPSQLSGGMARRIALARAIAMDPALIMYDEPFTGQDPIAMGVVVSLIRALNDALSMTSLLVSHDIYETMSISDKIYILSDGVAIASGSPEELQANQTEKVVQFLNGLPDGPVPFHYPADEFVNDILGATH
ncbi:MAG: ATP-binding cassette domain-containing protein [Pseudomonadales bacterium]|nr:ATP-binding cassette domain-containing protein [Pseudomonadales bacterium]